mgnify:CR=1 FL=1
MQLKKVKKLYYSIGEVSEITGLKQYVLRYWETEFAHLKPNKNSAGNRIYRQNDIENLIEIKKLLHEEKFTIKGARQYLSKPSQNTNQAELPKKIVKLTNSVDVRILKDLKNGLDDLIELIDEFKD